MIAKADDPADDENRRPAARVLADPFEQFLDRAGYRLLAGQRTVVDDHGSAVAVPAVRLNRIEYAGQLLCAGVADDRTFELGQARPVDVGRRTAFVFVAAHQRDRVAAARIRHRHARIGRNTDTEGNTRHYLERNAVLVEEQRFFTTAIEHERIAALQSRHQTAFARLLGDQQADGFLRHRLTRRAADVDQLGPRARVFQQAHRDQLVVNHDVRA